MWTSQVCESQRGTGQPGDAAEGRSVRLPFQKRKQSPRKFLFLFPVSSKSSMSRASPQPLANNPAGVSRSRAERAGLEAGLPWLPGPLRWHVMAFSLFNIFVLRRVAHYLRGDGQMSSRDHPAPSGFTNCRWILCGSLTTKETFIIGFLVLSFLAQL